MIVWPRRMRALRGNSIHSALGCGDGDELFPASGRRSYKAENGPGRGRDVPRIPAQALVPHPQLLRLTSGPQPENLIGAHRLVSGDCFISWRDRFYFWSPGDIQGSRNSLVHPQPRRRNRDICSPPNGARCSGHWPANPSLSVEPLLYH
jgi:hypothetical protein